MPNEPFAPPILPPVPPQSSTSGHWPDERPLLPSRLTGVAASIVLSIVGLASLFCVGGTAAALAFFLQNPSMLSDPTGLQPANMITGEVLFASFFFGFGAFAVLGALLVLGLRWRLRHALALRMPPIGIMIIALVGGLCVGLLPGWIAGQLSEAFPDLANSGTLEAIAELLTDGPWFGRVLLIVTIVIGAPILEELCFRGLLWNAVERIAPGLYGQGLALVITSLAFAVAHADPIQSPALLFTAFFLGWLRLMSGSLWPCILAHFVNNALAATLGLVLAGAEDDVGPSLWLALAGFAITMFVTVIAVFVRRRPFATPENAWARQPGEPFAS